MNSRLKGTIQGLLSGMFWGLDTSLNGLVLLMSPFISGDDKLLSSTLLLAFFHDFFSATILTSDLAVRGQLKMTIQKLKSKSAYFVMIAALFAGPLGMRAYLYAVEKLGTGLTATISALYPAIAALLGAILLKDYLTKRGWFGLSLTMVAVIFLGYSGSSNAGGDFIGFLAAGLCVLGWASESVITAYGMKDDILPKQALLIRQWVSSLVYLLFMFAEGDVIYSLSTIIASQSILFIIGLALIGTLSYLSYYSAIDTIGPVKATGLNVTYSIWTVIFSLFLFGGQLDIKLVISSILIIIGALFVIKN
ncbi:DMT family transporter [Streptococcus suis]|uniref:DMT family transporter n=2 Tax=Bacteria TaxID=2 RepID=A0A0Z8EKC9_STRSU|nr:DMT family transporter [Streptococcus suis]NQH53292.1 DMT family transporter [Streptococcus suis]NQS05690.1 DMT family transporter [Streptococcus suis]TII08972.1 DMT family transporter [Streptococcus suis]CYU63577.1 drug/metabolite transporter (DMT) superfamily permease [Streptococcus suis]CYX33637.1 drug/metabolite transporter (DMT) superfamily permease [Streptococcus suis]